MQRPGSAPQQVRYRAGQLAADALCAVFCTLRRQRCYVNAARVALVAALSALLARAATGCCVCCEARPLEAIAEAAIVGADYGSPSGLR
jgi:hypothetical protein